MPVSVLKLGVSDAPLFDLKEAEVAVPVSKPLRVVWIVKVE